MLPIRWLNRNPISSIDHFEVWRNGQNVSGNLPASAITFPDPVGCGFAAHYVIRQVMKSGAVCSVSSTGPAPHTRPCDQCAATTQFDIANAATYTQPVAPDSIVALFAAPNVTLTNQVAHAVSLPLPLELAGTRVLVNGQPAPLFFVSPTQINFHLPPNLSGVVPVTVQSAAGTTEGIALVGRNPGVFVSACRGIPAALVTGDGESFQSLCEFGQPVRLPAVADGKRYLVLFGTGLRGHQTVRVEFGGYVLQPTLYAGPQGLPGLDQINVELPPFLSTPGMSVRVIADGALANILALETQ